MPRGACYHARVAKQEFKSLFCDRFKCSTPEFEERVFRLCLPWYARLLAPVVRKANPDFFAEDFRFIRYLGAATSGREANSEMLGFQDVNRTKRSLFRTALRIRVSGRKAVGLSQQLFAGARRNSG
jgi:hypothetical protein